VARAGFEREVLRLLDRAGLPKPSTQVTPPVGGDDWSASTFNFPAQVVVRRPSGYRWHRSGAQLAVDAATVSNELVLGG
jgi:hypothetical protein